jgi:glycosyltransferase involved in cell wall biosynthesis
MDLLIAPYGRKVMIEGQKNTADYMSPLKIFDYMGTGVPFIASDLPTIREIIGDHQACWWCSPDNVEVWVSAVARLRQDDALRRTLAENAFHLVRSRYTWRHRAELILAAPRKEGLSCRENPRLP